MADPLPASLKDANFYRLLSRSFPQILVVHDVWPACLKNLSVAGVNESLDSFHSGDGGSPGFASIEEYRLHDGVKDPDFSAGAENCFLAGQIPEHIFAPNEDYCLYIVLRIMR